MQTRFNNDFFHLFDLPVMGFDFQLIGMVS